MVKKNNLIRVLCISIVIIFFIVSFFVYFIITSYPLSYKNYIKKYSKDYSLEPALVASLIKTESSFNAYAMSNKGAIGLMQILPSTASWLSKKYKIDYVDENDLYNPDINIRLGCLYLKYLTDRFENIDTALCAYNAGEGTVKIWLLKSEYSQDGKILNNIPFNETNNYLKKINNNLKIYKYLI